MLFSLLQFLNRLRLYQLGGEWFLRQTYPICTGQRLTIDTQGAERRVCGQALVPLTGPLLWDGFHEVPLQLADTGMMPEQVLLRLIELLYEGKSREERQCGGGEGAGKRVPGNLRQVDQENNEGRNKKK